MYDSLLLDTGRVLPIFLVAAVGILVVLVDAFRNDSPTIPILSAVGLLAAFALEGLRLFDPATAFYGQVYSGGAASFANMVILLGSIGSVALSVPYLKSVGRNYGEVHALILFATAGMMTLASAGSLVTLFVGLETMSVCLYVITGLAREEKGANESALKYFLLGAFSTGFFLYGIALLYGATGTMVFSEMNVGLAATGRTGIFVVGVGLLLIGFLFKVSAVPFHMWTPDVYQGAPTTLTGFMSTASKSAAFAALIVVLARALPVDMVMGEVQIALAAIAAVTMIVGNVIALAQTNLKRMLAYSSIAHAGYILAGIAAGSAEGYGGALFYLLAYTVMNLGAFGVIAALEWDGDQGADQTLDSLAGAGYRYPVLGVTMGVFMFALIGFPTLGGFIGKWLVLGAAVQSGMTWLAIVGVVASMVSAYYYLRVLVVMWMRSPEDAPEASRNTATLQPSTSAVLVACAVLLVVLGVFPGLVSGTTESFFDGLVQFAAAR